MTTKKQPGQAAMEIAEQCWGDPGLEHRAMDAALAEAFARRMDVALDVVQTAWEIIANASAAWVDSEWASAARQWRDECYFPLLSGKLTLPVVKEPYPEIMVRYFGDGKYRAWAEVDGREIDYFCSTPTRAFAAVYEHLKSTGRFR